MAVLHADGRFTIRETELSEIMNFLSSDTCTSVSVKSILKNGFLFPSFLIFHMISTKASYKVELRKWKESTQVKTWFLTILRPQ